MLKSILVLFLCFSALSGIAQVLTINELQDYINKPAANIGDTLIEKGWKLDAALSGTYQNDTFRTFSFGTLESDHEKAIAWLRIHFEKGRVNRIYYQAPDEEAYAALLAAIVKLNPQKTNGEISDDQLITSFIGENYVYQSIVKGSSHTILVMSKRYYLTLGQGK